MSITTRNILYSLCFFFLCFSKAFTQPEIEWERSYGGSKFDGPSMIQQTFDGGYIIAGATESFDGDVEDYKGNSDYWIIKLDNLGNIIWRKTYGGSDTEGANSIQQTNDGGYIVAGNSSSSNGDVGNNKGSFDYWVIKLDNQGDIDWEKNYGGSQWDWAYSTKQTNDGGYVVAGQSESSNRDVGSNKGSDDYWVVKLDNRGNIIWEKNYGGIKFDYPQAIQQTNDDGYVVVGTSGSSDGDVKNNNGNSD